MVAVTAKRAGRPDRVCRAALQLAEGPEGMEQQHRPYAQEVEQKSALAQSMRRFRVGTGRIAAPSGQHLDCSGAGENDFVSLRICPGDIDMELRHLRYFIAVAETGSLKFAAEKRLHTAQPSL